MKIKCLAINNSEMELVKLYLVIVLGKYLNSY